MLVFCCEKSQCQALERTQPGLLHGTGYIRTRTDDYIRHGTLTLFAALNYLDGRIIRRTAERHTHAEWLAFPKQIDKETPEGLALHLAAEAGINPDDTKAVRRFDKKREGRTTSNKKWVKPHDPDDNVGMTKHGAWDMIYKPEQITDLETGVIVAAEVPCGDEGDTTDLAARLLAAGETLAQVCEDPKQAKVFPTSPPTKVTSRWRRSAVFRRNGCG